MRKNEFFHEIAHRPLPWGQRSICVPVFYYDCMSMDAVYLVRKEKLQPMLPSPRLHPLRITPWHSPIALTCFEYRDTDIGPYNEVAISIPFTLDRPSPPFTGSLQKGPTETYLYVHQLPVSTQIALDAGVEFGGYPKFLADIDFDRTDTTIRCRLSEGERHIFTMESRILDLTVSPRAKTHAFTRRNQRLLRSEIIRNKRKSGVSKQADDIQIRFGNHPIAQELKQLGLGRLLAYSYAPEYQVILTPVIESFAC